jgi:putative NADH-flavin reductase
MAGSRLVREAITRGHTVTGVARAIGSGDAPALCTSFLEADAAAPEVVERVAAEHDVIILATRPSADAEPTVRSVVGSVLDAAGKHGRRVLVVGGAAPLRSNSGSDRLVIDDIRLVPAPWRAIAQASIDQLDACTGHSADWTYVSPPATFEPGTRTGGFRRGETTLLTAEDGVSRISAEDFAIAVLDEVESPRADVRHFTVGY